MDAALKTKWIKALRSGRYKQAPGLLQSKTGANCCLGVLCRVARLKKKKIGMYLGFLDNGSDYIFNLPGKFSLKLYEPILIRMNDKEGRSFSEIADWIEANIPTD